MNAKLTAIIIDDEPSARDILSKELELRYPYIRVLAQACDGLSAFPLISRLNPDLVFLDVRMPNESGLHLLDRIVGRRFQVVFYTTYRDYAYDAIQREAIGFLAKPLDPKELKKSVDRVVQKVEEARGMYKNLHRKLEVRTSGHLYHIPFADILHIEASGSYAAIHCKGDKKIVVSKNLKMLERLLDAPEFFRIHNSFIVNLQHVHSFDYRVHMCTMIDGKKVGMSVRRRESLKTRLREILLPTLKEIGTY
jgi:two-component system, LytTR family, response regulator